MTDTAPAGTAASVADRIRLALTRVVDPEIRKPITELDMVGGIDVAQDGRATVTVKLTIVGCPAADTIERDVREATASVTGVTAVDVDVTVMTRGERSALSEKLRGGKAKRAMPFGPDSLTRVYAVTSGKGGVGKSDGHGQSRCRTGRAGLAVGIVDADVYGFSIPGLVGLVDNAGAAVKPTQVDDMILPPVAHGVKVISIGMFVDDTSTAVAWRGPMLHRTIQQSLTDVYFGDLDVLLLDLPPGTGDVAISVGQLLPNAEVIVVTTPQAAAADVAERSGLVARQTGQKLLGVVENMSGLTQPDGTVLELFGSGGGAETARRLSKGQDAPVELLASVPLSLGLRLGATAASPVVLGQPRPGRRGDPSAGRPARRARARSRGSQARPQRRLTPGGRYCPPEAAVGRGWARDAPDARVSCTARRRDAVACPKRRCTPCRPGRRGAGRARRGLARPGAVGPGRKRGGAWRSVAPGPGGASRSGAAPPRAPAARAPRLPAHAATTKATTRRSEGRLCVVCCRGSGPSVERTSGLTTVPVASRADDGAGDAGGCREGEDTESDDHYCLFLWEVDELIYPLCASQKRSTIDLFLTDDVVLLHGCEAPRTPARVVRTRQHRGGGQGHAPHSVRRLATTQGARTRVRDEAHRAGRARLVLTGSGRVLAQTATDVAVALERAQAVWDDFVVAPQGEVTLATFPTAGQMLLPGLSAPSPRRRGSR